MFDNINDFTGDKFTPTIWEKAKKKARFARQFIRFVEAGFPRRQFNEKFYRRLAATFGQVAHWRDFYKEFFTSREGKARFLRQTLQHPCHGDPMFTYSDVGRALQHWLTHKYGERMQTMPTVEVRQHISQALLEEFKEAYRSQRLRPVRGYFFFSGKHVDLACPLVALTLHRGAVDRTDPEIARDDGFNPAVEWATQTFGENWAIGLLDGFDRQEQANLDPDYTKGYDLGNALAQEILPGVRIC